MKPSVVWSSQRYNQWQSSCPIFLTNTKAQLIPWDIQNSQEIFSRKVNMIPTLYLYISIESIFTFLWKSNTITLLTNLVLKTFAGKGTNLNHFHNPQRNLILNLYIQTFYVMRPLNFSSLYTAVCSTALTFFETKSTWQYNTSFQNKKANYSMYLYKAKENRVKWTVFLGAQPHLGPCTDTHTQIRY